MRSNSSSLNLHCFSCVGVLLSPSKRSSQSLKRISLNPIFRRSSSSGAALKLSVSGVRRYGSRRRICEIRSMDEGFSFDDWEDNAGVIEQVVSSSEGEESDGEVMLNTLHDTELPTARNRFLPTNNALTVTTHRLAMLRRGRRKNRSWTTSCSQRTLLLQIANEKLPDNKQRRRPTSHAVTRHEVQPESRKTTNLNQNRRLEKRLLTIETPAANANQRPHRRPLQPPADRTEDPLPVSKSPKKKTRELSAELVKPDKVGTT